MFVSFRLLFSFQTALIMQQPLNASVITPKVLLFKKDFLGYFIIYLYFKLTQWKKQLCNSLKPMANKEPANLWHQSVRLQHQRNHTNETRFNWSGRGFSRLLKPRPLVSGQAPRAEPMPYLPVSPTAKPEKIWLDLHGILQLPSGRANNRSTTLMYSTCPKNDRNKS